MKTQEYRGSETSTLEEMQRSYRLMNDHLAVASENSRSLSLMNAGDKRAEDFARYKSARLALEFASRYSTARQAVIATPEGIPTDISQSLTVTPQEVIDGAGKIMAESRAGYNSVRNKLN